MRKKCVFHEIGGLYHGSNSEFIIGPMVSQSMFAGARRQLIPRNRGPYHHDSDYASPHWCSNCRRPFPKNVAIHWPQFWWRPTMEGVLSLIPTIFPRDEKEWATSHNPFTPRSFTQQYYGWPEYAQNYRNHRLGMYQCESEVIQRTPKNHERCWL